MTGAILRLVRIESGRCQTSELPTMSARFASKTEIAGAQAPRVLAIASPRSQRL